MVEVAKQAQFEKREYPRIKASCPIRYQTDVDPDWHEATLVDYSATGILMECENVILKGTRLNIELLPGTLQKIPQISAEGIVVRFTMDDSGCYFHVGCEFLNVVRSLIQNVKSDEYPKSVE